MKKIIIILTFLVYNSIIAQELSFGVHWGAAVRGTPIADFQSALNSLNSDTVKWIRAEFSWAAIHIAPNTFNWHRIPANVQSLVDRGYKIIAMLKDTPSWQTTNNTGDPQLDRYFAPIDTIEWVKFVDSVVTKFKSQIKYWEIWNETDGGFFQTTTPRQKHIQYRNLLASAYRKIKSIDPTAKVLVSGFTTKVMSMPGRKIYLDSLFAVNFHQYFDIMNIHSYELNYELKNIKEIMQNNGIGNYPIWITETNPWRELVPYNNAQITSNFLCNWIRDTLVPYFNPQVTCWFNLRSFNPCVPTVCNICDSTCTAYGLLDSLYQPLVLPAYNACYEQLTTSVPTTMINSSSILLYPNPFSTNTTLQTEYFLNNATLTIYNLYGQQVKYM